MSKVKIVLGALAIVGLSAPAALAVSVLDPTPDQSFSDDENTGYVQVDEDGAIRACNENPDTPAGEELTGYAYVNANGGEAEAPTYGNGYVGATDTDGDGNPDDCPGPDETLEVPAP